ncbi:MAG: hypothetical protein AAFQ98_12515 [Bacteroidota bacterium]
MSAKMIGKSKWITGALLIMCVVAMGKLNLEAWSSFSPEGNQVLSGIFVNQNNEVAATECTQQKVEAPAVEAWSHKVKRVLNAWGQASMKKLFFSDAAPQYQTTVCTVEIQPVHFLPTARPKTTQSVRL